MTEWATIFLTTFSILSAIIGFITIFVMTLASFGDKHYTRGVILAVITLSYVSAMITLVVVIFRAGARGLQ